MLCLGYYGIGHYGIMVCVGYYGIVVLWYYGISDYGVRALLCEGVMALWSYDCMVSRVLWYYGLWYAGIMLLWKCGQEGVKGIMVF